MKMTKVFCGLCILLVSLLALLPSSLALAQDGEEPSEEPDEETISIEPTYRTLEDTAPGVSFEFEAALKYHGKSPREFDLIASGPSGWSINVKPSYGEQVIRSILLEPDKEIPNRIRVTATPPFLPLPKPGEYTITFEVSSGSLRDTVEFKGIITATYSLDVYPTEQLYNTTVTAGKNNFFSIVIQNSGTGTLDNIKLSSRKPTGWTIEFTPSEMESLPANGFQTIDVNIKPAPDTIAGDYQITLVTDSTLQRADMDIRVTVETPTIWGWVGIVIIALVIAGLTYVFMRFSRR